MMQSLPPRAGRRALLLAALAAFSGITAHAASPEEELKARHQGLIGAYNQRDVKTLRTFFTPDYRYEELRGHKISLDEYMMGFEEMFKALPKPGKDSAKLAQIKISGNTATAVEARMVQGISGKVTGPSKTGQTWRKVDGVWKLAIEREMKE